MTEFQKLLDENERLLAAAIDDCDYDCDDDCDDDYDCDGDGDEPDQFRNDVEADADVLSGAGYGTDEDYGYYGE